MDVSSFQQGIKIDFVFEVSKSCNKQSMSFRKIERIISKILDFADMYSSTFTTTQLIFPEDGTWNSTKYVEIIADT